MTTYYDDNFGKWEGTEDKEVRSHYHKVQRQNVLKTCVDCGRSVRIKKDYECCNSCADARERGWGM